MKLERISYSQVAMLHKCGEQYRRRYIEGEILPPGIALIRGKSVHAPIEANLVAKMETGALLPLEQVQSLAADTVRAALQADFVLDGDYAAMGIAKARDLVTDEVVGLSTLHATKVAPAIEPSAVEVKIEVPPSNALPVTLVGVLDLIDDREGIRDTKTAQKSPAADAADVSDQLTTYELLHRARYGEPAKGLGLDVLVRTPGRGELKYVPLRTTRSTEDLLPFLRRVQAAVRAIEAEIFIPAASDTWQCSAKWCGYSSSCAFFRGRPRPQS